ncbi:MAG: DedA family protein [Nitrospinae bacterium]|nr:DedA family protein [Nitrospinota bacterium]
MDYIKWLVDVVLHLDKHIGFLIDLYGNWTYVIFFTIIFMETGLVVAPLLPGDSLLFAIGAFAALGHFNVYMMAGLLVIAAILGDFVNYWVGYYVGPKVFQKENSWVINTKNLIKTRDFFERHGGKTIIIARFMPVIRTFAPFVAGIGKMSYGRFLAFNVTGAISWVALFVFGGYFFGNIPVVKSNFTLVIMAIIVMSITPGVYHFTQSRLAQRSSGEAGKVDEKDMN